MVVLHPISLPKGGQGGQKGDGKEIYEKGKAVKCMESKHLMEMSE